MKLGILGGTFDPIHLGHLLMAEMARESLALQRVLFVPAGDPPHKTDRPTTPAQHRRTMVEMALADNPNFELSPVDLARPGPHYSVDTVRFIRSQYNLSTDECYFIIGSDSLIDLPTWHNAGELINHCQLVIACRPTFQPDLADLEQAIPGLSRRLHWLEMPEIGIAASEIRSRMRAGQSIQYQVVDPVREYIERCGLYRDT